MKQQSMKRYPSLELKALEHLVPPGNSELDPIGEISDVNIVEDNIEVASVTNEGVTNKDKDVGLLGELLVGVELGDEGLEDLVGDGGEDFVVGIS
ncbi:hypothetical protein Cni_G12662 [Canna indica]|uniref:Uncharacterized protein n=1 Tax=Canna indica TaxID=4628 RepID=A0AAQ3K8V3_9LILI|nr:hypothetical protein Cni_G12662 [Canna indica]